MSDPTGMSFFILVIFAIFIGILWIILPFAVFGIKGKLDVLIKNLKEMQTTMTEIKSVLSRTQ